jgi:hypothetical protein
LFIVIHAGQKNLLWHSCRAFSRQSRAVGINTEHSRQSRAAAWRQAGPSHMCTPGRSPSAPYGRAAPSGGRGGHHGHAQRPPRARVSGLCRCGRPPRVRVGVTCHHERRRPAWVNAGAGSTAPGTIFLPIPDLQLQLRDAAGEEESTYLPLGDLRPGAGRRPLASSPDEGAEEGLLQLRVRGGEMRPPHPSGAGRETGWRCFFCVPPLKIR